MKIVEGSEELLCSSSGGLCKELSEDESLSLLPSLFRGSKPNVWWIAKGNTKYVNNLFIF